MVLFNTLFLSELNADITFVAGSTQVTLQIDADANGYINRGDTIRVRSNLFFTAPSDAWLIPPTVNFGTLGIANVVMNDLGGNTFQADVTLNNWNQNINYQSINVTVYAVSNIDLVYREQIVASPLIDVAQVEGTNPNALPLTAGLGDMITIEITDIRRQADPLGGTVCTVNLENIGGNITTPMVHIAGGLFRVQFTPPAGINYTGPLTIRLDDPMLGHPAVAYQTNSITVDTVGPMVDFTNTTVTVQSGNAVAIPGDVIRITAAVTNFDNENVTVTCTDLTAARANPDLSGGQPMPLIISNGINNPATWQLDVTLTEDVFKNTSVPFIITFVDDAGNVTTVTRYLSIDLDMPNFVNPTANVLYPDGTDSIHDVATTSCQLEFTATIPINAPPDTLTVSIDLSPIGGSANQVMMRVGLTDVYRTTYLVPQGALEDGVAYSFIVSARDLANNLVARATTPDIRIDNNPPVLSGAQLTAPTANITVGTLFTIQCNATGLETNGSVSVDLSSIGLGANENLPHVGSNVYRRSFTLLDARDPAVPWVTDGFTSFTVSGNDTVLGGALLGHIVTTTTNQMMIDNEPPAILALASESQHLLYPADAFGYVRIGDSMSFFAQVASAPVSVTINMVNLGQGNSENMYPSTNPSYPSDENWYEYTLPGGVTEGLINRQNSQFRVTARDDADNTHTADFFVPIDNVPIKTSAFDVSVTYSNAPAPPDDTDPSIINLNKTVLLTVTLSQPYTDLFAGADAAVVDLSNFGGLGIENMFYNVATNAYSLSFINNTALNYDSASHKFNVTIKDQSGNRTFSESSMRRVDNWPPTINTVNATIVGGGAIAKIGDTIRFTAEVINNENVAPVINLSNLGHSAEQAMTLASIDVGVSTYRYDALVNEGTINSAATTWTITSRDNDLNYVTAITPAITVDNVRPTVATGLQVTKAAPVDIIRYNESITFTMTLASDTTLTSITLDLQPIGLTANEPMTILDVATGSIASLTVTTAMAGAEYMNYRFVATITDSAANSITANSNLLTEVDCQPVTFSNAQIVIWQDNGDNPLPGIANIGDVLMVYATANNYFDAVASATIGSGTVDFATATLVFNPARNRHEAQFTVKTPGIEGWGTLTGSTDQVYFKLSGLDNVNNLTEVPAQVSTFTIRNLAPEIDMANTQIELSPNRYRDFIGTTPVYNLASDAVGDRLVASITFAAALPMHRAWLDFSEFGSGTVELTVTGASAETSAAGIAVTKFNPMEFVQKRVYLHAMDQAGNISIASQSFLIDNVAPTLNSATFDGTKLTVNLSEEFFNLEYRNFEIVGSNPPPLNTPVYLNFVSTAPTILEDLSSFEINLAADHMREMAQWASTPIYLKVSTDNIATAPLTDLSGNSIPTVNFFPITITDSTWREPARINQFTMNHNWPNTITLDMFFNKSMDPSSVIASNAVLLFDNLTYDFTAVDYSSGYVFQPSDDANFTWMLSNTHLRVVMSNEGRDWIARKIGSSTRQLRFATRSAAHIFAYDSLGKPMDPVPTSNPVIAADNRPTPAFDFYGPPTAPKLDLASQVLILSANDRMLLSNNDFDVADTFDPLIGMPQPTNGTRVSGFFNKAVLHDIDNGGNTVLQLEPIDITVNNEYASTTVTLRLTNNDLLNVFELFKANATPVWRMEVGADAFKNLWDTPNNRYLPSGNPGAMNLVPPVGYTVATFAACALSDKPPVNQKLASELIFDIEVYPPQIGTVIVPLQPQIAPTVRIVQQDALTTHISSGTFVSYTERTVAGRLRGVYRFTNTVAFPANLQRVPAMIEVNGITDIFGNTYGLVASHAYDLNTRNDAAPDGFSDTASPAIEIDTKKPLVASIIPGDVIGRIPINSTFKVNFDELMDPSVTPVLRLATTSQIISFTFAGWTATATAEFRNDIAFVSTLPNGVWYYEVTGGQDESGNAHDGTLPNSFPVQVRTYAPEVQPGNITLRTIQTTISNDILVSQPWASVVGDGIFSIQYDAPPSQFLPHSLEIFDPVANTRLGRANIVTTPLGTMATATFRDIDFTPAVYPGATGPTNYSVRVIDSSMNETETITTVIYDNQPPDVATFDLSGIGSTTVDTWYYRQTSGNFTANVVTTSTTDDLRLAVYSHATNATSTIGLLAGFIPGTYSISTGTALINGTYTLTIVDMAGNIGTGPSSKRLIVDDTSPNVISVLPNDAIGNSPAGLTEIRAIFSEPMDASAALQPTAEVATVGHTIPLTFTGWADPLVATTAVFVNTNGITSALASGSYTYRVSNGRDLAGNALIATTDGTHNVTVYPDGPFARIDSITDQRHIYGNANGFMTNYALNDAYGNGSASLQINYVAGPFNPPHYLYVYQSDNTLVGSYTIPGGLPAGNPVTVYFPTDFGPFVPGEDTYKFRLLDSAGNLSGGVSGGYLPNELRFDTTDPVINSQITMSGPGIATDTGSGLTFYHSPAVGDTTFSIVTTQPESMRLLVFKDTPILATYSADTITADTLTHVATFGSALLSGNTYIVTGVDTASNIAIGTASRTMLIADSVPSSVSSATPSIAGTLAAGAGTFDIIFDEHMNTGIAPSLELNNGVASISMTFVSWLATDTVRFTNTNTISGIVGTYSYIISGARDLAGNFNTVPAIGAFEVELFTTSPDLTAFQLVSQQPHLFGTTDLINRPFSATVPPGIATLTFTYNVGHPYRTPHTIYMYDSNNNLASYSEILPAGTTTVSITHNLLGAPIATGSYSFRLMDDIGNFSATYTLPIVYDQVVPTINIATFSNFSTAAASPVFYNEQLHGGLFTRFETNASDPLLLVFSGIAPVATHTYTMSSNISTGVSSYTLSPAEASLIAEGAYWATAADMAGNMADGAASTTLLIIDRTAPVALTLNTPGGQPLSSNPIGSTTIDIDFNEPMNQLATANPSLALATAGAQIDFAFDSWVDTDTARFINTTPITISIPQGNYHAMIKAYDLTGNKLDGDSGLTADIRSRGPVIAGTVTRSFQQTTASDTSEILLNRPFSMLVPTASSTLSITLAQAPDSLPTHLHWTLGDVTVASTTLALVGNNATFTWDAATGPIPLPAGATTYVMRLADNNGDLSVESFNWRVDNVAPSVQEPVVSGGVVNTASATVFFNPAKHTFVNFRFNAVETETPRLRISGPNSTDTYDLNNAGTNMWANNFEGRFSRDGNLPMPDGRYAIDMVDQAGNVALLASGSPVVYDVVIDGVAPIVNSYITRFAGNPVTSFAPGSGNLTIEAESPEAGVTDTGIFWMEVLNDSGVVINKLPLSNPAVASFTASWDGKNAAGNLVIDGYYKFRATDYAGNAAAVSSQVFARTSPFKVVSAEQTSSTTVKIWFNHDLEAASVAGTNVVSNPALAIGAITLTDSRAIAFSVPGFTHAASYDFTVTAGTITSVFGANIAAPDNTATLVADASGPILTGVSFAGLTGQQEFKVVFDEKYNPTTASIAGNYTLISASGAVTIAQATTQSDLKSVLLTAAENLIENASYTVFAANIEDTLGNLSPIPNSFNFKGQDLTPPVMTVTAFSNPANEFDIIVVVTSNELLKTSPNLQVTQSGAPVITTLMQQGAEPTSYMMGVHLSPAYPGNGSLSVSGEDLAGNVGNGNSTFTVAYVSAAAASQLVSADSRLKLDFAADSLKEDAMVKILKHELSKETETTGIRTSLQSQLRAGLRSSARQNEAEPDNIQRNHAELIPVSDAYEIGIAANKIDKGFNVFLEAPAASETTGFGLFYQVGDVWKLVSADMRKDGTFAAKAASSQIFAIMQDVVSPEISISEETNGNEPFRTARPEFRGRIDDFGAGVDSGSVVAQINGGPAQAVQFDSSGSFKFVSSAELVGGNHDLMIKASDRTGNSTRMSPLRFQVVVPLSIGQIMQYPNPANRRAFIRISANRGDLNDDLVKVKVYDTAGHKVCTLDGVRAVRENWGINSRYLYDIPWDLRNENGRNVANGVYFARIEVRDPDNPSAKIRKNFKLAVLR